MNGKTPFHSNCYSEQKDKIGTKMPRGSYDNQLNCKNDWSSSQTGPSSHMHPLNSLRNSSICTTLEGLSLQPTPVDHEFEGHNLNKSSPSHIPLRLKDSFPILSPSKSPRKARRIIPFLSRDSNTRAVAWDTEGRIEKMEHLYSELKEKMDGTTVESNGLKDTLAMYKAKGPILIFR